MPDFANVFIQRFVSADREQKNKVIIHRRLWTFLKTILA
jgi:hypothetical protein